MTLVITPTLTMSVRTAPRKTAASHYQRLSHYEDGDAYLTAAALGPRFKIRWCESEKRSQIESSLSNKVSTDTAAESTVKQVLSPVTKAPKLEYDFFSFMSSTETKTSTSQTSGADAEIKDYLNQPCYVQ